MRRREFITLLGGAAAVWPLAVRAQTKQTRRLGVLMGLVAGDPEATSRRATVGNGLRPCPHRAALWRPPCSVARFTQSAALARVAATRQRTRSMILPPTGGRRLPTSRLFGGRNMDLDK